MRNSAKILQSIRICSYTKFCQNCTFLFFLWNKLIINTTFALFCFPYSLLLNIQLHSCFLLKLLYSIYNVSLSPLHLKVETYFGHKRTALSCTMKRTPIPMINYSSQYSQLFLLFKLLRIVFT